MIGVRRVMARRRHGARVYLYQYWRAEIARAGGGKRHLGLFERQEDAGRAYDAAKRQAKPHGKLNFPTDADKVARFLWSRRGARRCPTVALAPTAAADPCRVGARAGGPRRGPGGHPEAGAGSRQWRVAPAAGRLTVAAPEAEAEGAALYAAFRVLKAAGRWGYPNLLRDPAAPLFPWAGVFDAVAEGGAVRIVLRPFPGFAGSPALDQARALLARGLPMRVEIGAAPAGDGLRWF